jgi:hypothetical protein
VVNASRFTCKIQLAKHEIDQTIDLGAVNFAGFRKAFRDIDWEFEADRLQFLDRTWPSIGVSNEDDGTLLWTSAYRPLPPEFLDRDEFRRNMAVSFVVRLENPPNPPETYDLTSGVNLADCYFETCEDHLIERLFELFFDYDFESLYPLLYSMQVIHLNDASP